MPELNEIISSRKQRRDKGGKHRKKANSGNAVQSGGSTKSIALKTLSSIFNKTKEKK